MMCQVGEECRMFVDNKLALNINHLSQQTGFHNQDIQELFID